MNAVHAGRDDDTVQNTFEPNWQPPVGMVKERGGFEGDEESDEHHRRDAEEHRGEREERDREKHFTEMKSGRGAHIQVEVGMVDVVKSPEERDHVVGPMPPPIGIIHKQKRGDGRGPRRSAQPIQQADMSILGPNRDRQRDWQHSEPNDRESGNREQTIAQETAQRAEMLTPKWETPLQQKQRNENAAKQRASDVIHQGKFWN